MELNRKKSCVNGVELKKIEALTPLKRKKTALKVFSQKKRGVNGVEQQN